MSTHNAERAWRRWPRYAAAAASLTLVAVAGCAVAAPADTRWVATRSTAPVGGGTPTPVSPTPSPSPTAPPLRPIPVRVAIFGDSQATALYATRPRNVSRYLRLSDESISACGIMRGRVVSRSGERFDLIGACPNWLDAWRTDARRARPDIALVVLGAWDVFDVKTKDTTLVFASPEWDATFLALLRSGLAAIRESGAQIALAELPCYRPRPTNPRPPGFWPERGQDDRTRHVNDLLRQLADGVHIFTVTPAPAFCANRAIGDNHAYRYDGVHYLQPGAKVYFDTIIPQLLALPT